MKRFLIVTALALVTSAPLAFAANAPTPPLSLATTMHCDALDKTFAQDRAYFKSESAYLTAEQNALSLCRHDRHKNGGAEPGIRLLPKI